MEATIDARSATDPMVMPWWILLIQGISALVLGLFFLFRPGITALLVVQFIGIWWLVEGVFTLVMLFSDQSRWGWKLFSGILGIVVGLMVVGQPVVSTIIVASVYIIIIAVQGLIIGAFDLVHAFRGGGWGVGALGVLSVLFGILLLIQPVAAAFAIPLVFGVLGTIFGVAGIFAAFGVKRVQAQQM